jgi:uncharacterized protein YndB with AHSA1/START domain
MESPEYRCRDDALIAASPSACFAPLADLATYERWWTLVQITPLSGGSRLELGVRFRFTGARPGGAATSWIAEVLEIEPPSRIELSYASGDLLGRTAWELMAEPGGTRVAYVYRSVRANGAASAASLARFGTSLHSVAIRADALAGLARILGGPGSELDDAAWRARVQEQVAAGVRALRR